MATNFPTSLDSFTNPTASSDLTSPDHAGQHTNINDAVAALEAKVGINSSAVTTSLDYKIANIPATSITSGTLASARISGSYTGITGVGTLSAGSIPATLLTGTVASARISGSYTGITAVGTLTGLSVSSTTSGTNYTASSNNYFVTGSTSTGSTVDYGNLGYTGANADSAMPWCTGPALGGRTGWGFYSAVAGGYTMGFRGNTANTTKYFWVSSTSMFGTSPDDAKNQAAINVVNGTAWFNAMGSGTGATVVNSYGFLAYVSSRRELKENIVTVESTDSINRILSLRPVEFTMKPEYVQFPNELTSFDKKRGFIAQEVADVDHWYGQWGWVDENQRMVTQEALDGQTNLAEATPIYWNHDAVIADLVGSIQNLNNRIFILENTSGTAS